MIRMKLDNPKWDLGIYKTGKSLRMKIRLLHFYRLEHLFPESYLDSQTGSNNY